MISSLVFAPAAQATRHPCADVKVGHDTAYRVQSGGPTPPPCSIVTHTIRTWMSHRYNRTWIDDGLGSGYYCEITRLDTARCYFPGNGYRQMFFKLHSAAARKLLTGPGHHRLNVPKVPPSLQ